ncbi:MAG: isoprenylcysteine carboxylmethyltransferase family protein [Bacteroidales bacterium]|jgi:protein-S-isoprenylcysteine O-methyltransferase Ste14|nr:isoprenylcysteine carboxylmethyltransferase family protein [Bacteroidales bacterium]
MALIDSLENNGNKLFKKRGIIPFYILLLALPILLFGNSSFYESISPEFGETVLKPIVLVVSLLISMIGLVIRCYAIGTTPHGTSGRNTDKQVAKQLNTKGIYSIVRHPLYLGNYLMWAGFLVFSFDILLFIIVSLVFWLYYERIMFAEERYLEKQFGNSYLDWSRKVPAFLPAFRQFEKSEIPFSLKTILRREYSGVFAMTLIYTIIDYITAFKFEALTITDRFPFIPLRISFYVLIMMLFVMLTLRTMKHHTKILDRVEGRD